MKMNKKGFTLIELLVVVLIIGILASIALPQYFKAVEKSRAAEVLSIFSAVAGAQQRYYLVNNSYASTFAGLDVEFPTSTPGTMASGASYNTDNFTVSLSSNVTDSGAGVQAVRRSGKYIYTLGKVYSNGQLVCQDQDGTSICASMGNFSTGVVS